MYTWKSHLLIIIVINVHSCYLGNTDMNKEIQRKSYAIPLNMCTAEQSVSIPGYLQSFTFDMAERIFAPGLLSKCWTEKYTSQTFVIRMDKKRAAGGY